MPDWTSAQSNAIYARNSNIVVSAAAGSGKTAVLVERVISMITDRENPVDIDRLLIVTFTNAAASEMKNRISKRLNEILKEDMNDSNIIRQLSLLPNANICTIDSFCIHLVRENFFNLNIDQDFTIMDESEKSLIEQQIADEIIGELYEDNDDAFRSLVEMLSTTKSDAAIAQTIMNLHHYIMAQAFPFEWLDLSCEMYNPDISLNDSMIKNYVFNEIRELLSLCIELVDQSAASLVEDDELYDKYSDMLDKERTMFINAYNMVVGGSWDDVREAVEKISFAATPYKRNYTSPSKATLVKNKDIYKSVVYDGIKPLIPMDTEDYKLDCQKVYPIIKLLSEIVKNFHNRVFEQKRELNSYTFSDIEHFAIKLLYTKDENGSISKTQLAHDYEQNYEEILVDEYQDTNAAQDTLFDMLSNGRNRFIVGDVKQSIYRFRLAMPFIFNQRKNNCAPYNRDSDAVNQCIILDKNFRSRKGICDYTNFIFSKIMSERVGEMDYTNAEYLNYGASYSESNIPCAQIHLVQTPEEEDIDEYEARQAARLIIDKINRKEQIQDGETTRDVRYSDFAVLFRAPKNRLSVYTKVFSEYAIPTVANNKINLFENNEIIILLSLIRVIDNPVQDIPLLATLMSSFYGFSPDDIASAKVHYEAGNLYSSISRDKEKFGVFLSDLERYREYASSMSVENLLMQIISETSYLSVISAMGNYEQRRLNVLKFVDIAKRFDKGENVGLTAFVRYIDSIIESKLSVESADVSNAGNDSVMLMSVHNSKGLEYPICIFVSTCHKYNNEDQKSLIQIHQKAGLGVKIHNEELLYRYNSLQYSVIKDMNSYAAMSENLRVLYVAVTRAKEQFITFYSNKKLNHHIDKLSKKIIDGKIYPYVAKGIQCDGDFMLLCALLHKDAGKLRELCSDKIDFDVHSDFDLQIHFCDDMDETEAPEQETAEPDSCLVDEIKNKLAFSYERLELSDFISKRTASSLDDKAHSFAFFASSKPAFMNSFGLTPAQRGSAMHSFMQHCDYVLAKKDIEKEILRLTSLHFITKEQADALDRERLNTLFKSDFAKRMFSSNHIYREIKVSSFVDVSELEDTDYHDKVLVQGIADCVFEEDHELVLVDYKTDKVKSDEELLDRYKNQLMFYKNAVSKTLQKPVKEVMLYSFCLNKICIYK